MLNERSGETRTTGTNKKPPTYRMKSSSPKHIFLVACCLCTLPLSSGSPHHYFQDYSDEWDNNSAENLALCLTHLRALQIQPQMTKFVMDFCNAIRQNVPRTGSDDNEAMYKRFLFHYSKTQSPHLKNTLSAVHPLLHLAPKLSERRMDRTLYSPHNGRNPDVYSR
ncbi:neuromedin-S [Amblyraja radiata]|uniref:neuromedin-S n=1 Tax=Amblyraja radiata TaxID=386614 RepID=UPI00140315B6|nr:neuromedin-S [Amblyraja radiata]